MWKLLEYEEPTEHNYIQGSWCKRWKSRLQRERRKRESYLIGVLWRLPASVAAIPLMDETRNKLRICFLYLPRARAMPPMKNNEYRIQSLATIEMIQAGPGPLIMFVKDWIVRLTVVEDGHYLCNVKANIFMNQTFPKRQTKK